MFGILFSGINGFTSSTIAEQPRLNEVAFQNIKLSTNKLNFSHHVEPTLAIDDNLIYVGFKNAATHDGGGLAVSYTYSTNGSSWSSPYNMKQFWSTGAGQSDPWMQIFNNTLYYVYLEYPFGAEGQSQMTLSQTSDQGTAWNYTRATFGPAFADKETFTIDENGYIYLAYDDVREYTTEMRLSRSFDGGNTFVENVTMSDVISPNYLAPYVVSAGSGVLYNVFSYFAESYAQSDIFFDKSIDYGETWGTDTDLNLSYNASAFTQGESGRPSKSTLPAMAVGQDGRIYVVWEDVSRDLEKTDWDVYMKYSDDMGSTWSNNLRINKIAEGESWMPDIDIDSSGNAYIAYYDNNIFGQSNLMYRIYYPTNDSLSGEYRISTEGTAPKFTRLGDYVTIRLDDNDNFHVVWTDGRNDVMDVFYASDMLDTIETKFDSIYISNNPPTTSTTTTSSSSLTTTSSSSTSTSKDSESTLNVTPILIATIGIITIRKLNKKKF